MFQPFDYQHDCLRSIEKARRQGKKTALVVMASGLGKTITAAFDVKRWLKTNPKSKILYLCHQNEILSQARAKFQLIIGGSDSLYGCYHGVEKSRHAKFLFASFQTMREKFRRFDRKEFDYIVVDESHHVPAATYFPVARYFKPKFFLGMTATPDRTDMQDIRTLFGDEVHSLDLSNALARGLLTRIDYRLLTDEIVELGKVENPYKMSLTELNRKIFVPKRDKEVVKIVKRKIASVKSPRVMIFCPSIRYTEELRKRIPDAVPVHSGLGRHLQEERIQEFRDGSISTILTVDKFNEGIDIPEVNVVVFLRSTQSKTVFYQQLGRGLRKVAGKSKVLVLDFIANCERLLMVSELAESAQNISRNRPKIGKYAPKETLIVNGGSFKFTETAKNVLDVLEKVRTGYTPEVLIKQLQDFAKHLNKIPTFHEVEVAPREQVAHPATFINVFGSWNTTLSAAGLPLGRRYKKYSDADLINQYSREFNLLKRVPVRKDIEVASKEERTASPDVFYRRFGGLTKLRKIINLPVLRVYKVDENSKSVLKKQFLSEYKRLKQVPRQRDIGAASKEGRTSSALTFKKAFGPTWSDVVRAMKLIPRSSVRPKIFNKKILIKQLRSLRKKIGRVPSTTDIRKFSKQKVIASLSTFIKTFGGIREIHKAAKLI